MKLRLKLFDIIIILFVSILTFFSVYKVYIIPQDRLQALIRSRDGEWTFPVEAEETLDISGPLGITTVKLGKNKAWIESSPCDNQTCVAAGFITRNGQWAACLPNNVLLMIHGLGGGDVDSVAW
ncbi:MAG: NusG domain II-containing protein [Treponema sp.]|nr:NusG domain II-containing protein [Treponema sp.]